MQIWERMRPSVLELQGFWTLATSIIVSIIVVINWLLVAVSVFCHDLKLRACMSYTCLEFQGRNSPRTQNTLMSWVPLVATSLVGHIWLGLRTVPYYGYGRKKYGWLRLNLSVTRTVYIVFNLLNGTVRVKKRVYGRIYGYYLDMKQTTGKEQY